MMSQTEVSISRSSSRASLSSKGTADSMGSSNGETIRVVVRVRPANERELRAMDKEIVHLEGRDTIHLQVGKGEKTFRFNAVMGGECDQSSFFENSGIAQLLESALDGYAATVFAYGQTGSGKTYSMSGHEEQIADLVRHGHHDHNGSTAHDGIIQRSIAYLFRRIEDQPQDTGKTFKIRASYAELYNEQVFDLLNMNNQSLPVRWNAKRGFYVQDQYIVECESMQDVMEVVSEGHRNRRVASHELNQDSSRSHSILTLYIESESIDHDDGHRVTRHGKIRFCDLAGSERLKDSKSDGVTLSETGAINKSLFTLSNVISALASSSGNNHGSSNNNQHNSHIPYRNSKLTKLLMDSLGGDSMALMICCCSPSGTYLEETLNTLKYASRAARIKNRPTVQMDGKEQLIARLREEIKLLKMENEYLRQQLGGDFVAQKSSPTNGKSSMLPNIGNNTNNIEQQQQLGLVPPGLGPSPPQRQPSSGKTSPKALVAQAQRHASSNSVGKAGTGIDNVLNGYQSEINRLKMENRDIRTREVIAERMFHNAMIENEKLQKKLEHLEEIFVHDDPQKRDGSTGGAGDSRLETENRNLRERLNEMRQTLQKYQSNTTNGDSDTSVVNSLKMENMQLGQLVNNLRARETALIKALKAANGGSQAQLQQHHQYQQQPYDFQKQHSSYQQQQQQQQQQGFYPNQRQPTTYQIVDNDEAPPGLIVHENKSADFLFD